MANICFQKFWSSFYSFKTYRRLWLHVLSPSKFYQPPVFNLNFFIRKVSLELSDFIKIKPLQLTTDNFKIRRADNNQHLNFCTEKALPNRALYRLASGAIGLFYGTRDETDNLPRWYASIGLMISGSLPRINTMQRATQILCAVS